MIFVLRAFEGARPSRLRRLTSVTAAFSLPTGVVSAVSLSLLMLSTAASPSQAARPPRHVSPASVSIRVSTAKLRSGPGSDHKASALLDEGHSATVLKHHGDWVKLRLESGREGWVRHDLLTLNKSASKSAHRDSDEESEPSRHTASSRRKHHDEQVAEHTEKRHKSHVSAPAPKKHPISTAAVHPHPAHPAAKHLSLVQAVTKAEAIVHKAEASEEAKTADINATDSSTPEAGTVTLAAAPPAESSPRTERLLNRALAYRGTPYRMGATGNGAFDCSGFTQYLFGTEGERIPRTAAEQYAHGKPVTKDALQPGDLVFFKNTYKHGVSHVGIYIGNGSFVHASSGHGRGVTVTRLEEAYYVNHWAGARRPH